MGASTVDYDIRCLLNNILHPLPWLHVTLIGFWPGTTSFPQVTRRLAEGRSRLTSLCGRGYPYPATRADDIAKYKSTTFFTSVPLLRLYAFGWPHPSKSHQHFYVKNEPSRRGHAVPLRKCYIPRPRMLCSWARVLYMLCIYDNRFSMVGVTIIKFWSCSSLSYHRTSS